MTIESHGDAVERWSHAAQGREAAVTGEVIRSHRGEHATAAGIVYRPKFIPDDVHRVLSTHPEHRLDRRQHESRRKSVVGDEAAALAV
jgi:hypothetical protein